MPQPIGVVEQSKKWGLANAAKETWGPYGRGWSTSHFSAHLLEPQYAPLIGVPLAWTPGTGGPVSGTPLYAPLDQEGDFDQDRANIEAYMAEYEGKLRGRIVLIAFPPEVEPQDRAAMRRYSSSELSDRAELPDPLEPIDIDYRNPGPPGRSRRAPPLQRLCAELCPPRFSRSSAATCETASISSSPTKARA